MDSSGKKKILRHTELDVYKKSFSAAMTVFEMSKQFPPEEKYTLTDQIRRSARSVCANEAEAWRKRIYRSHFISKLSDSEAEAAETQTWIHFSAKCGYIDLEKAKELYREYDAIIAMLVAMRKHPEHWCVQH